MARKTVRIYSCRKHPRWTLETSAPIIDATLSVVCPLCRDEWMKSSSGQDIAKELPPAMREVLGMKLNN